MKYSVSEFYLFLNKYAALKKKKKKTIILVNQIIKRGHGNLKVPWARKLDSRALLIGGGYIRKCSEIKEKLPVC